MIQVKLQFLIFFKYKGKEGKTERVQDRCWFLEIYIFCRFNFWSYVNILNNSKVKLNFKLSSLK